MGRATDRPWGVGLVSPAPRPPVAEVTIGWLARTTVLALVTALLAAPVQAQDVGSVALPAATPSQVTATTTETPSQPLDPLVARLESLIVRYHQSVGQPLSDEARRSALAAVQSMLLVGIALPAIEAAVDEAIRVATPGAFVPFELAVPSQVRGARWGGSGSAPSPAEPEAEPMRPAPEVLAKPDPVREAMLEARRARLERRANYVEWKDRLRPRRTLISIGVPLFLAGKALGFTAAIAHRAAAGGTGGTTVTAAQVWITAIPAAGNFIFAAGAYSPGHVVAGILEVGGIGAAIAGLAIPIDLPHDEDPTALRSRGIRPTLAWVPSPGGGAIVGRF